MQLSGLGIPILIALSFALSVVGLYVFILALSHNLLWSADEGANVIFPPGEENAPEDPAASGEQIAGLRGSLHGREARHDELTDRIAADRSSAFAAFVFVTLGVLWLAIGSLAGLTASLELHLPDWLSAYQPLTFGRIRVVHLNIVAYGWVSMTQMGVSLWLLPRLLRTELVGSAYAIAGAAFWNSGLLLGVIAILFGWSDGLEWLEIPWQIAPLFVIGGALTAIPLFLTLARRRVQHLYVSVWYIGAALVWFPILFLIAKLPVHFGVEQATMNWWFGHNVLAYWMTPLALAQAYYLVPKVLGKPIHSYNLSLIAFWAAALFYGQVGIHHLIGGPVPTWLVSVSVVASVMMVLPVLAFAINYFQTMRGDWGTLRYSPTVRFVAVGAVSYVLVSLQGSLEATRQFNAIVHFTHFTVAHAHLGVYGFVSFILFGAIYFAMPRIVDYEWPYPKLISAHFWLSAVGFGIYFVALSIGGYLQGLAMLDAKRPFLESVALTIPYLEARSVGGALMVLAHLIFLFHFLVMALRFGPRRDTPPVLGWRLWKGRTL